MIFNGKKKKDAISLYQKSNDEYLTLSQNTGKSSEELLKIRVENSNNAFLKAKKIFSGINQLPDEYTTSILEYEKANNEFNSILNSIRTNFENINLEKDGIGSAELTAGVGVATGVGVSVFGPTAAMAIATTFGTASTGAAISSLTGVAATNAALAWLGGGAVAAGGAGMAGGNALLALAGPVGWAIGGTALIGSGVLLRSKNNKIIEEANEKAKELQVINKELKNSLDQIQELIKQTLSHITSIESLLNILNESSTLTNYSELEKSQVRILLSIKTNLNSLTRLLTSKVN